VRPGISATRHSASWTPIPLGRRVRPLPGGDQYLGFVFAEAVTPDEVEKALTTASQRLRPVIG
jgi:L-amino acid ligase C-terminal domain 2